MRFRGKIYGADNHLIDRSAEVGGKRREEDGNLQIRFANPPYGLREFVIESHEWVRLTCANGGVGWILLEEIGEGFSSPDRCGYGCAEDREPGEGAVA